MKHEKQKSQETPVTRQRLMVLKIVEMVEIALRGINYFSIFFKKAFLYSLWPHQCLFRNGFKVIY